MRIWMAIAAGIALLIPSASVAQGRANVRAAVASIAARSPDNVKLDANRKPAEVLRFLGLRRGAKVLDMFGANRYWAEIIVPAIGPSGTVTVWQPSQFLNDKRKAEFATFAGGRRNVALISSPFEAPDLGRARYDFAIMNLDYHDVYWQSAERKIARMEPDAWLRHLYAAMKPGAVVGIIDHVASPNADVRLTVEKLHRIDPAVIRADFKRAGFVLEAESNLLRNSADDHRLGVFDEKIRGKTDRVLYRFRKPRR